MSKTQNKKTMKNIIALIVILLLASIVFSSHAQTKGKKEIRTERRHKMDSAKVAFLTERLTLSKEQSEKFWPLYNEYNTKKRALRKEQGALKSLDGNLTATDEQLKSDLNKRIELKQKDVDLEKEYLSKFQQVLSIRQVAELYHSERLFAKQMIRNLKDGKRSEKRK
jgi:outer membrane PBP1 activator LpoA protein